MDEAKRLGKIITIAMVIAIGLYIVFLKNFGVDIVLGPSMEPTFQNKEALIYQKNNNLSIEKQDVVLFWANEYDIYIKRVIAVGGDHIEVKDGKVYVNEEEQKEPYISTDYVEGDIDEVVPEGTCFVMGDNRDVSSDSRSFGVVSYERIEGVVLKLFY